MATTARKRQSEAEGHAVMDARSPVAPHLAPTVSAPLNSVPVMTGTHFHAVDEKGRIIIPAKLRPALAEQFWMMRDDNDNIAIYNNRTGLDVLARCERMMALHPGDDMVALAVERITGSAEKVVAEGNWRVPIPEVLRFYAQLEKEVVTVGVLNHAVLWNRERWEQAQGRRLQDEDVRRKQAEIMRGAASGIAALERTLQMEGDQAASYGQEQVEEIEFAPSNVTRPRGAESYVGVAGAAGAGRGAFAATPSASDGGRSAREIALSKLGR